MQFSKIRIPREASFRDHNREGLGNPGNLLWSETKGRSSLSSSCTPQMPRVCSGRAETRMKALVKGHPVSPASYNAGAGTL